MKQIKPSLTLLVFTVSLTIQVSTFSQISSSDPASSLSEFMGLELAVGGALDQGASHFYSLDGVGMWNYINLGILDSGRRKGFYGLGVPAVAWFSVRDRAPSGISSMYSLATQLRLNCQLHPEHESWWFFIASGPEYRWINTPDKNFNLMMMQIEMGFKRKKESSLISNFEFGATSSIMSKNHGLNLNGFVSFFMRMYLFRNIWK